MGDFCGCLVGIDRTRSVYFRVAEEKIKMGSRSLHVATAEETGH